MRTHLRKLMEKNDGMTLVEVIVALVLFSMVFLILLYGINMALKVMGAGNAIQTAGQNSISELELDKATAKTGTLWIQGVGSVGGYFYTQTTEASTGGLSTSATMTAFQATDLTSIGTPVAPQPTSVTLSWNPYVPNINDIPVLDSNGDINLKGLNVAVEKMNNENFWDMIVQKDGKIINPPQNDPSCYGKHKTFNYDRIVFTNTFEPSGSGTQSSIEQLFFSNTKTAIQYENQGDRSAYNTSFVYFAGGITGKYSNKNDLNQNRSQFTVYSFTKDSAVLDKTLIYFEHSTTVSLEHQGNGTNQVSYTYTIPAGFYLLPNGTDILKAAYDVTEQEKYKTKVSEAGYALPTTGEATDPDVIQLKKELLDRDIKMQIPNDSAQWGTVQQNSKFE